MAPLVLLVVSTKNVEPAAVASRSRYIYKYKTDGGISKIISLQMHEHSYKTPRVSTLASDNQIKVNKQIMCDAKEFK